LAWWQSQPFLPAQQPKPSIAVDAFDYSTVMTSIQAVFGKRQRDSKSNYLANQVQKDFGR
jgi:hypothetical protein